MRKPDSVEKQAQLADELLAQANGAEPDAGNLNSDHSKEAAEEGQPQVVEKKEEQKEIPDPQASNSSAENDAYKARYEVIKGKYDAEVPRLTQQVRDLQAQIDELTQEKERQQALANNQNTPAEPKEPTESQAFNRLREELGDENLASLITQLVKEQAPKPQVAEDDLNEIKTQLNTIQQSEQQRQEEVLFEARKNKLSQLLSAEGVDFDAINNNELFSMQGQFLDKVDPLTGMVRRDILSHAFMNDQLTVVARLFKEFHAEQNKAAGSQALEQHVQVQPSSSSVDSHSDAQEVYFTPQQIAEFYKNYSKYPPEERDRMEQSILRQAQSAN